MATDMTRPIRREVDGGRHGRLTVEFTPHGVITREKGSPDVFGPLPYETIHTMNLKMAAGYQNGRGRRVRR